MQARSLFGVPGSGELKNATTFGTVSGDRIASRILGDHLSLGLVFHADKFSIGRNSITRSVDVADQFGCLCKLK
jgi:hypothetical protein